MEVFIYIAVMVVLSIIALIAFFGLFMMFYTVEQQNVSLIERFGRFVRLAKPGLNFKIPYIERVAGRVNLRVQQLDVRAETKTKDNVFVNVVIAIQYHVMKGREYDAYYKLENPEIQINSYVFDVVRAQVPLIILDDLFEKKDDIAVAVKTELNETMNDFGFEILNTLVTDIEPDQKVKDAMNDINAAEREKVASRERGESDKIMKVKAAEAEAESKALQGKGIADQRRAIVLGLQESVDGFQKSVPGSTPQDVMNLVLLTQYFDTIKDVGDKSKTNTILIPHGPGALTDIATQLRDAMIVANEVGRVS